MRVSRVRCEGVFGVKRVSVEGAAHLVLADGVVPLHPRDAVFAAMVTVSCRGAHGQVPVKMVAFAFRPAEGGQAEWLRWGPSR